MLRRDGTKVILLAYADDLALFEDAQLIGWVKRKLEANFKLTDLGVSTHFLGVTIDENNERIMLTQQPLIKKLLMTNMIDCKDAPKSLPFSHTLYEPRFSLSPDEISEMEGVPYREILGSLLYLSRRTRPELATVVSMLGKYAASPAPRQWKPMKQVLRYLHGTLDYGLRIEKSCDLVIEAWSDADWARHQDKRRSRSGIVLTIGENPVSWSSKLQTSVAMSTSEAEFCALSEM